MKGALHEFERKFPSRAGALGPSESIPISVEPVNDSFRTIGIRSHSPPISVAEPVSTLNTPRDAGSLSQLRKRKRGERCCDAGFRTTVQAGADAGRLRVIIARGKSTA